MSKKDDFDVDVYNKQKRDNKDKLRSELESAEKCIEEMEIDVENLLSDLNDNPDCVPAAMAVKSTKNEVVVTLKFGAKGLDAQFFGIPKPQTVDDKERLCDLACKLCDKGVICKEKRDEIIFKALGGGPGQYPGCE